MPFYQTWTQRAYGSQANLMMKGLMDGQIMYYLENNKFYPEVDASILIPYEGQGMPSPADALDKLEQMLKVKISQSPRFEYTIINYGEECAVTINAPFALFKGQGNPGYLIAKVTKQGEVTYVGPP
jgi:hypothetical protein